MEDKNDPVFCALSFGPGGGGAHQGPGDRQAAEAKLTEFLRRMREERTYEPIPGREEKGRRFAALARELSQIYEVGLDILRTPDSIEAAPAPILFRLFQGYDAAAGRAVGDV